LFYFISAATFW